MNNVQTNAENLRQAVTDARNQAEREALILSKGRGFLQSRGAWVIVSTYRGEPEVTDGTIPFKGTQKQIDELMIKYGNDANVRGIYIDGGWDWATSLRDMRECGADEPWISEWSVPVWEKEQGGEA